MMETVRLRLEFDHILSKSHKTEGLQRCWILLKPQHQIISDLSSYLLHAFDLQSYCPRGLILSMEGFALPPFESTSILKDKDIIRVEKNGGLSSELVMLGDEGNSLEVVEIVETQPVAAGMNLLANEEFEKESGGYQSEEEEDAPEQAKDAVQVEDSREVKKVSKKRKASKELKISKRKKTKSASAEKRIVVAEDIGNNVSEDQSGTLSSAKVDERSESSKASPNRKRLTQPQENGKMTADATLTPSGTMKLPSRSARRKKAKRKWLREKLKAERKEQYHRKLLNGSDQSSKKANQIVSQDSDEVSESDGEELQKDSQQLDQDSDAEDDVVPVVIRPGHIRFEPLSKVGADEAVQKNQIPLENFRWNGITSKKKGQKWGKEKVTSYKMNDYKNVNQGCSRTRNYEARPVFNHINFEKLEFYASLPKEGDVIAYRLIELSSSWTPELSSYRVGKISRYDIESNRVRLVPVPKYPIIPEKKMGDDASAELSEMSSYAKDGSLWIEFSSLVEVRLVTRGNFNSEKSTAGVSDVGGRDEGTETGFKCNNGNEACASVQENGEVNVWEEINQALKAKKEELSQEDNWNKTQSSGRRPWSYKALRGSALGPTMALLRSQNEL
ncbi:coilin isoform X2 [Manihot esculenta]|uniref:Uncharacterized protein n=1 Tax=Manihot esculenta TaxID=3983 RepID=A0A2C9UQ34_MANES|nr:coilin isoform X2 [Manihot esculenta]OAY32483.1 hypothetical protein MANES_13G021500v8 [Manihot esculenta]